METITCVRDRHDLRRKAGLLTIQEAAQRIGANHWRLRYLIAVGRAFGPSVQIGGKPRRYYLIGQLDELRSCFAATA